MLDQFFNRLIVLYGHPESADDDAFLEEYREMLAGIDAGVLKRAGDVIRNSHARRGWPTPGEVRRAVDAAAAEIEQQRRRFVVEPEAPQFDWVNKGDARFEAALARARAEAPVYARMLEKRGRIKVRREPEGPLKKQANATITDLTKRMTGDRD